MADKQALTPVEAMARTLREKWDACPYSIHKRPPFVAHSFDDDGRYWVVGSSAVSVLHGAHGPLPWAQMWASALNDAGPPAAKEGER